MEFFTIEDDTVVVELNPKLYNLEAVYSAAYQLMEDYYIYFDGDPEKNIIVNIACKESDKTSSETLKMGAKIFLNQLVNYTYYKINAKQKEMLRALLLKKSFANVSLEEQNADGQISMAVAKDAYCETVAEESSNECKTSEEEADAKTDEQTEADDEWSFDDPEGIAIPWEEKYGV